MFNVAPVMSSNTWGLKTEHGLGICLWSFELESGKNASKQGILITPQLPLTSACVLDGEQGSSPSYRLKDFHSHIHCPVKPGMLAPHHRPLTDLVTNSSLSLGSILLPPNQVSRRNFLIPPVFELYTWHISSCF